MAGGKSGCGSILAFYGVILGGGAVWAAYEWVTLAWKRGDYGPAFTLGAVVAGVTVVAGVWWVHQEFGVFWWRDRRSRGERDDELQA